jgi:hypothetical protein
MKQASLFDTGFSGPAKQPFPGHETRTVVPCDPTVKPVEAKRLSKQCQAILDRLKQGAATNVGLAEIALKYTSRISDLRAAGYDIQVIDRCHETGSVLYALNEE